MIRRGRGRSSLIVSQRWQLADGLMGFHTFRSPHNSSCLLHPIESIRRGKRWRPANATKGIQLWRDRSWEPRIHWYPTVSKHHHTRVQNATDWQLASPHSRIQDATESGGGRWRYIMVNVCRVLFSFHLKTKILLSKNNALPITFLASPSLLLEIQNGRQHESRPLRGTIQGLSEGNSEAKTPTSRRCDYQGYNFG